MLFFWFDITCLTEERPLHTFVVAGLDCEGINNHSLRATGISRLYNSGIAEKLIMECSGHLSVEGIFIQSYERTNDKQHQQVLSVLSSSSVTNYAIDNSAVTNSLTVCNQGQSVSKIIAASHANKENVLELKDFHGFTVYFHL